MIQAIVFALAMCVSCRDAQGPPDLRLGIPEPTVELQEAPGCVRFEVTLVSGGEPTSQSVYIPNWPCPSGELRVLTDTAMVFDSTTGSLRIGVVLENVGTVPVVAPVQVYYRPGGGGIERYDANGAFVSGLPDILAYQPDSTSAGDRAYWFFHGVLAPAGQPQVLAPGARTARRWVEFRGTSWAYRTRLKVFASGKEQSALVPAEPPDSASGEFFALSTTVHDSVTNMPVQRNLIEVFFVTSASQPQRQALLDSVAGVVVGGRRFPTGGGLYYVRLPAVQTLAQLRQILDRLRASPIVDEASPVLYAPVGTNYLRPVDGSGWSGWNVRPQFPSSGPREALERLQAPLAWGCTTGDPGIGMAVVDIDVRAHNDVPFNPARSEGVGTRPGGNGHGVRVSSIMAASGNNNQGMAGVVWKRDLGLYDIGVADSAHARFIALSIETAVRQGARIVNVSLGISEFWGIRPQYAWHGGNALDSLIIKAQAQIYHDMVRRLLADGYDPLFVVPAGNFDNTIAGADAYWNVWGAVKQSYPANFLVVGATDQLPDQLANFSGRGTSVTIAALGDDVYSHFDLSDATSPALGTSFSVPQISGIAGLLLAMDPQLTAGQLIQYIQQGAVNGSVVADGIPVANAYESLRVAAAQVGAPLCGNRVWLSGPSIKIERGALVETIPISVPANSIPHDLEVQHGGKRIAYHVSDTTTSNVPTTQSVVLMNGSWIAGPTTPIAADSAGGTANSVVGRSHNGDTTLVVRWSADAGWHVTLDVRVQVNGQTVRSRQRTLPPIPPPLGVNEPAGEYLFAVGAYPMVGHDALVAVNRIRGLRVSSTTWGWVPYSATIFRVHLDDPGLQIDSLGVLSDSAVFDIAMSEDGRENLLRIGRDSLWDTANGGTWTTQGCRVTWSRPDFGSATSTFLYDSVAARRTEPSTGCQSDRGEIWLGRGTNAPRIAPVWPRPFVPITSHGARSSSW